MRVHPHTRGDIGHVTCSVRLVSGSPPHAWGHQLRQAREEIQERFTPTRVGTS